MRTISKYAIISAFVSIVSTAAAQSKPAYLDTTLPPEQRAAELVKRMTLEEKASQLVNQARAIPRLECAGVRLVERGAAWRDQPMARPSFLSRSAWRATFDAAGHPSNGEVHRHRRPHQACAGSARQRRQSMFFQGLDFWAPNINIFRDPRWGRGQETYGEDPFLTARMGVAFVTGMQGDDPKYYRVISTPKHFAVHSGPEPTRHTADVDVSKHDELDTYLPAFRATVD